METWTVIPTLVILGLIVCVVFVVFEVGCDTLFLLFSISYD